jgi:hypothetical protein
MARAVKTSNLTLHKPAGLCSGNVMCLPKECFWAVERHRCVRLPKTQKSVSRPSRQCGTLNISQPYRPSRPITLLSYNLMQLNSIAPYNIEFTRYCALLDIRDAKSSAKGIRCIRPGHEYWKMIGRKWKGGPPQAEIREMAFQHTAGPTAISKCS